MRVEKNSINVLTVRFENVREGFEHWFLLSSDRHHDSNACNRELEVEHLEKIKKLKGHVLDFGDIFDVMQGRYDPRRTYKEMRPEYQKIMADEDRSYLDIVVNDAIGFYERYAAQFLLIAKGNHESAIHEHNDTDLIERLVFGINKEKKTNIFKGCYGGWVRFNFVIGGTQRESINLKYFHGSGGGGPVTKGTIQSNRQAVFLPDAQIVVNGHIHESWILALKRERLSDKGSVYQDVQYHVRTGTYKDDYLDGSSGWHVQKGSPPKPMGAVWLRFFHDRKHVRLELLQDVR